MLKFSRDYWLDGVTLNALADIFEIVNHFCQMEFKWDVLGILGDLLNMVLLKKF